MKHILMIIILTGALMSCYITPEIPDFDQANWLAPIINCDDNKVEMAELIKENEELILSSGQAIIKKILGQPAENELYNRNQKFFHYNLTAADTCPNIDRQLRLSIRFDALDRAKEILILEN